MSVTGRPRRYPCLLSLVIARGTQYQDLFEVAVALAPFTDHDIHLPDPERYVGREDATASGWDEMLDHARDSAGIEGVASARGIPPG